MTKEELLQRLTAVCPEELIHSAYDEDETIQRPTVFLRASLNHKNAPGKSAVRVTKPGPEDAVVIRMWPPRSSPSRTVRRASFTTLEAAVQYLEMALPLGLWGANIPDIFKEPE